MEDRHKSTRSLTSETRQRVDSILDRGRNLPPDATRDELLRGIETIRARILVLRSTPHKELGESTATLLDVLLEHFRTGALHFDPSKVR